MDWADANSKKLDKCFFVMAKIVTRDGDAYLPIFERLSRERRLIESERELKLLALSIYKDNQHETA